ncbi:denticleless protein homolog [Strongylocentrotus purpuratus]|uniref:Denticleless protein homolog n=1 Tax=Strongylocentrotus purpuratus TaxID=7668 RepID=A0A7M7RDA8_STRPU|nr:denticleless protein homolog [Strongylocentrotus purpuratus]
MLPRSLITSYHQERRRWAWKSQTKNLCGALDSCLERFECQREDEILFTNPEFVDGIPPFACKFAEQPSISHLLAAADEDGRVFIYNTNVNGPASQVQDWSAHNNAIFDVAWSYTEPRLVTASGDQSAALWDIKTAKCLATFKQHKCSLKSLSFRPWDGHVFASGSRDGSIMIWDDRCKKKGKGSSQLPVICISDAHINQATAKAQPKRRRKLAPELPTINSSYSVSVVLFQKEDVLLSAGSADGIVKVWDIRKLKSSGSSSPTPSHQFPYSGTSNRKRGFSSLALTSTRTRLFASRTDSVVNEYDLSGVLGSQPVARYRGHMNSTFFVKAAISPDDLYLLSGSSDNNAYIWKIGEPESPSVTLEGHGAEVTSVTWCPTDFTKVVTCSDDNTMRIWKMSTGQVTHVDGVNRVVGRARRCEKKPVTESQETDSGPSQSGSESSRSTPTHKTSESPLSPQPSPTPSSTKKRRFSLKEWVTTSPKPSRPASPVPSPKRLKSESSESGQASQPDGESESVLKRKMTLENTEETSAIKKVKVSNSGAALAALATSSVLTTRISDSKSSVSNQGSQANEETEFALKRRMTVENVEDIGDLKKVKRDHSGAALVPLETTKCLSDETGAIMGTDDKDLVKDTPQSSLASPIATTSPPSNETSDDYSGNCDGIDKENLNKDRSKLDQPETTLTSIQRSPLKDDLPMNRPKCSSLSKSATKRNITSHFPASPRANEGQGRGEKEEGGSPEMQQQNLKECFKEKKNGGLVQSKRKSITRPIDGYFQPIQRKNKSDT